MTIAQFIGIVCSINLPYARKWLKEHIKAFKGMLKDRDTARKFLKSYCSLSITSESATELVYGVSARITRDARVVFERLGSEPANEICEAGRRFTEEIRKKASEYGLQIDPMAMTAIIEPKKF